MAGIGMAAHKRGALTEEDWALAAGAAPKLLQRSLELIDASGMTAADIRADALANRYQIIYVDYLQIVEPENRKTSRTEQVSAISRGFQQTAHGNGMLVVALSQLARAEKSRDESRTFEPTMSDLRESRTDRTGRRRRPAALPGKPSQTQRQPAGAQAGQKQGR